MNKKDKKKERKLKAEEVWQKRNEEFHRSGGQIGEKPKPITSNKVTFDAPKLSEPFSISFNPYGVVGSSRIKSNGVKIEGTYTSKQNMSYYDNYKKYLEPSSIELLHAEDFYEGKFDLEDARDNNG